jgi:hypothetical protein
VPKKKNKWGIKCWLNCCSKTSYVYDLGIYPGSDHENREAKVTKKNTKKVTKKLVKKGKKGKKKPHPNDGIIEEQQVEIIAEMSLITVKI